MIKKLLAVSVLNMLLIGSVNAEGMISNFTNKVSDEWNKSMAGKSELYVPLYAWHNTYAYDDTSKYNENTWGLGYGRSYLDEDKDQHGFYAMAFLDSHSDVESMVGYSYTKNWYKDKYFAGLGYTVLLTSRSDFSYVPIPGILPIASVGYDNVKLSVTYVPGGHNNGNVAFFWGTYAF